MSTETRPVCEGRCDTANESARCGWCPLSDHRLLPATLAGQLSMQASDWREIVRYEEEQGK